MLRFMEPLFFSLESYSLFQSFNTVVLNMSILVFLVSVSLI